MKKKDINILVVFILNLIFPIFSFAQTQSIIDSFGNKIVWDGAYYDFRDANGVQMVKLWIPPNVEAVKGVLISGHGGGGGDSRKFARDKNVQAFAKRLGFAVAGLHNFPGNEIYSGGKYGGGAKAYFTALDLFAKMGFHPELINIPYAIYGSSNGGSTAYGFVNYAPEKALCFVSNVASPSYPEVPVNMALKVPGVFIIGKYDALTGYSGYKFTNELMTTVLPQGALWSWAVELKGHEDGYSFDVFVKLVEQAVKARYPKDANPKKEVVKLKMLARDEGWLVDHESWNQGLVYINSYDKYSRDKSRAGWVINEDVAFVYRSMATHFNPLNLKIVGVNKTFNPNTNPGTMFSLGGPVLNPGDELHITCDIDSFTNYNRIDFFNGAHLIGTVKAGSKPSIKVRVDANESVYCLTALATDKVGIQRTSDPFHFFVRDAQQDYRKNIQLKEFSFQKFELVSVNLNKKMREIIPDCEDSVLIAYCLDEELEKQFWFSNEKISEFWNLFGEQHDFINLVQRKNSTADANFNFVITHDCNMIIKAAYGSDGLYLLFEINDDSDVAWPNEYLSTVKEYFYPHFDAVSFLIDRRPVKEIFDPKNRSLLLSPHSTITSTTKEYQCVTGTNKEKPKGFRRIIPDPWDMEPKYWKFEDAQKYLGIIVKNVKTNYFYKMQEWFIPWSEFGQDYEPKIETRLAFSPGYNDRDVDEYLPPSFNTSGGTNKNSDALRWIQRKPKQWEFHPTEGNSANPPYNWGEIELGPMIRY